MGTFSDKVIDASRQNNSLLCIGLDPVQERLPNHLKKKGDIVAFNRAIIEATSDLVCAYKPNLAYYEVLGPRGWDILQKTLKAIPRDNGIFVIADGKRGDVAHSAEAYASAIFDTFGFDALTVNPYLGFDALEPFAKRQDKGIFVLCKTSNPGSSDFQDLKIKLGDNTYTHLYEAVARRTVEANINGNYGLVVGATHPGELRGIRDIAPSLPILIPGIGVQGGDLAASVRDGCDEHGELAIISVSRQVLYASSGKDFAEAAMKVAQGLRDAINAIRSKTLRAAPSRQDSSRGEGIRS